MANRALVFDIAGVQSRARLQQHDVAFISERLRQMFDPPWHDDELARPEIDGAVTESHAQAALNDQEQLILALMMMPVEATLKLGELDLEIPQLAGDPWVPMVGETCESLSEVDLVHRSIIAAWSLPAPAAAHATRIAPICAASAGEAAGKTPSRAAVPTVKAAAPPASAASMRAGRSIEPATITGLSTPAQTALISPGTSPAKR